MPPSTEHPPTRRVDDPSAARGAAQPAGRLARRLPLVYLMGLAAMIPWPLIGFGLMRSYFDQPSDVFLLFGGITGLGVALIGMVVAALSETAFAAAVVLVWCLGLVVPPACFVRRLDSRRFVLVLLGAQSLFSFAQAAVGVLMIIIKGA